MAYHPQSTDGGLPMNYLMSSIMYLIYMMHITAKLFGKWRLLPVWVSSSESRLEWTMFFEWISKCFEDTLAVFLPCLSFDHSVSMKIHCLILNDHYVGRISETALWGSLFFSTVLHSKLELLLYWVVNTSLSTILLQCLHVCLVLTFMCFYKWQIKFLNSTVNKYGTHCWLKTNSQVAHMFCVSANNPHLIKGKLAKPTHEFFSLWCHAVPASWIYVMNWHPCLQATKPHYCATQQIKWK